MTQPYIGSIWMFGGNFQILQYLFCAGQLVDIANNETLYSLLGTTFGGNGQTTFALPDLRGRVPIGQGTLGGTTYVMGQSAGNQSVTLTTAQMPAHNHLINVANSNASTATAANTLFFANAIDAGAAITEYTNTVGAVPMASNMIGASTGGNQPFEIVQPVLAASYMIAMFGIYPSQN
jgi:microcystin-dependent protein